MKEVLYFQAGPLANHVGTHFWNTQESYFTYDDAHDPLVFHDRSFREGLTLEGEQTYCPRLLLFDRKSQFGSLSDGLYGPENNEDTPQWEGDVVEYRQDPISKSDYHTRLEEESPDNDDEEDAEGKDATPSSVRFWPDYSRVYFHPRSLHRLPDLADWEAADGDWTKSKETFSQFEAENDLMENDVRQFVEECDGLQGIQIMYDCSRFGGFTEAFLVAFRDEFPKLPSLAFPLLSASSYAPVDADEEEIVMKSINDALCLRGLEDQSTINIPIQAPSTWKKDLWADQIDLDVHTPYQTSAIIATHIENATLPFRLKASEHDLSSFSSILNRSGDFRTVHMGGIYPVPLSLDWEKEGEKRIFDLSAAAQRDTSSQVEYHARLHLSRGFSSADIPAYDSLSTTSIPPPFSIHSPPYPTPSSFPRFYPRTSPLHAAKSRVLTTLTASSAPARLFATHARLAQTCLDQRAGVVARMGFEFDEVRELKEDLWALADRYAGDDVRALNGGEAADGELGEDEE